MKSPQDTNKLERQVTKQFYEGMEWYSQGYDCPYEDSPRKLGWLAAQEMDVIKKRYLQAAKDTFIDF